MSGIVKTTTLKRNPVAPLILLYFDLNSNLDGIIATSLERSGLTTNGYLRPG